MPDNTDRHIPFSQADLKSILEHEVSKPTGQTAELAGHNIYQVGASFYGGPDDPSTPGTHGYKGDELTGTHAFAELKMGTALGGLAHGTQLVVTYNGKSVVATKLDIGAGGDQVDGLPRAIDLWYQTAQAIDFDGTGVVEVYRADGKPMNIPGATVGQVKGPGGVAGALDTAADDTGAAVSSAAEFASKAGALLFTQAGWIRLLKLIGGVAIGLITIKAIFNTAGIQTPAVPIPV